MTITRILVGFDGSENAQRALAWATDLAVAIDAEVIVVHAVGLIARDDHARRVEPTPATSRAERDARFEATWSPSLRAAGARFRFEVHDGPPVAVLLGLVETLGADLVVVGRRGAGAVPDLLLGSTSTQVSQRAPVPVVISPDVGQ